MNRDELLNVLAAFEAEGLEYTLIGATAMGFHGLIRATEDVDLFIRASAENVERLRRALRKAYPDDPGVEDIQTEDLLGDYPAVRFYPVKGDLFFDILTRLGDAASFDTVESESKRVENIQVSVATPAALYALKRNTLRPLDWQDAASLKSGSVSGKTIMPVERYRSGEEMNAAPIRIIVDGDAFERFIRHCARYRRLSPRARQRGVFKFRTVEEAQAARNAPTLGG